jgi:hypothetical protein
VVNLETGERVVFPERMLAGEVVYAPVAELRQANLLPAAFPADEPLAEPALGAPGSQALHVIAPDPLLAIARPPGVQLPTTAIVPAAAQVALPDESAEVSGIHMPLGSIAPFVMGVGFCIVFLGIITNVAFLIVGLIWMLAGAIGWIRIGLMEAAHAPHGAQEDQENVEVAA